MNKETQEIKIASVQMPNSLSVDGNFKHIMECLKNLEKDKSDLVLFPECSLSSFSASPEVRSCTREHLNPMLEEIRLWSLDNSTSVILPTIVVEESKFYNSGFYLHQGNLEQFFKVGLTESEKVFFSLPTIKSKKIFEIKNKKFAVLICFEASEESWKYFSEGEIDFILWPGYWGWQEGAAWESEIKSYGTPNNIFENMTKWKCPLFQSNFSYNDFDPPGPQGLSFFISSDNRVIKQGGFRQNEILRHTIKF